MPWKEAAARLGAGRLVSGLKELKGTMKKRDFKRLVSTTAAQILAVHPDVKPKNARRWARKATGTRASKALGGKKASVGAKAAAEAAGAVVLTAGASKVADKRVADKLKQRPSLRTRATKVVRPKVAQQVDSGMPDAGPST